MLLEIVALRTITKAVAETLEWHGIDMRTRHSSKSFAPRSELRDLMKSLQAENALTLIR